MKHCLALLGFILVSQLGWSQHQINEHITIKSSTVQTQWAWTDGLIYQYQSDDNYVSIGAQVGLIQAKAWESLRMGYARDLHWWNQNLQFEAQVLLNPFSDYLQEWNLAVLLHHKTSHWNLTFGSHQRRFGLSPLGQRLSNGQDDPIYEWLNTIYRAEFFVWNRNKQTNITGFITNQDLFLFNQETNPWLGISGRYLAGEHLLCFLEGIYKPAGVMNIQAAYFGWQARIGILYTWGKN